MQTNHESFPKSQTVQFLRVKNPYIRIIKLNSRKSISGRLYKALVNKRILAQDSAPTKWIKLGFIMGVEQWVISSNFIYRLNIDIRSLSRGIKILSLSYISPQHLFKANILQIDTCQKLSLHGPKENFDDKIAHICMY